MTWEELKEKAKEMGYKLSSIKYSEVSHLYLGSEYQEEALTYNGKIYFPSHSFTPSISLSASSAQQNKP